ncbi:hypothetical protein CYLTODRAFT_163775 [Cylindrobasidium torrendii FP15055 ss-10]|uniref:Uncharacterized protein n=1 Tax=Cylindrobasidium torrendii FP15055 ss-10 TaxID=1314674 RepID=A0A0D7AWQ0_9AGAR|nr:hypothetical protein CYLTODRAFT_163775 [Cylindrobasidium torrendii FP15055 ss-10]
MQATIGNVVAGSLFAGLTSFGMTLAPVLLPAIGATMLTALGVSKAGAIASRARQFGGWVRGKFGR